MAWISGLIAVTGGLAGDRGTSSGPGSALAAANELDAVHGHLPDPVVQVRRLRDDEGRVERADADHEVVALETLDRRVDAVAAARGAAGGFRPGAPRGGQRQPPPPPGSRGGGLVWPA